MENGKSVILILVVLATIAALSVATSPKEKEVATPMSAVATGTSHLGWLPPAIAGVLVIILCIWKLINRRF